MRKPRNIGAGLKPRPVVPDQPAKPAARGGWINRTLIVQRLHLGETLEWVFTLTAAPSKDAWFISRVAQGDVPGEPRIMSVTRCATEQEAELNWGTLKGAYSKDKYVWSEFAGVNAKPINIYPVDPEPDDPYFPAQLGDV